MNNLKRYLNLGAVLIALLLPLAAHAQLGTALGCYLGAGVGSAASTNSTACKTGPAKLYGIRFVNTTTTTVYLRLYNLATAPTCSSATGFVESIPILPAFAATSAPPIIDLSDVPIVFTTGLGFCLTGGSGNTDNTNAVTGIFGVLKYN